MSSVAWAAYAASLTGVDSVEDAEAKFNALPDTEQAAWAAVVAAVSGTSSAKASAPLALPE